VRRERTDTLAVTSSSLAILHRTLEALEIIKATLRFGQPTFRDLQNLEVPRAMKTVEKKLIERNLDLLFEFEKYVLEHPEITEKIPRDAVVFMKVAGDEKFNLWSERQAKKQAKKGAPLISVTVKKMGPVHSRIEGLALERAA
jgi:hypothetical protein